jgi:PAS domain S-box-containing protein
MKAISIRARLIFFSILFSFVGLVLVGGYSYIIARKALLNRTFDQLTSIREEKAKQVERFFFDRLREVELASHLELTKQLTEDLIEAKLSGRNDISHTITLPKPVFNFFVTAGCYSSFGIGISNQQFYFVNIGGENSNQKITLSALNTTVLSDFFEQVVTVNTPLISDFSHGTLLNSYSAFVAAPVHSASGVVIGVLFLEITDKAMNQVMAERLDEMGMGKTGEVYLVGDDYLLRSSSRFLDNSVLSVNCRTEATELAFTGKDGVSKVTDYRNVKVLSSFRPLELAGLRWAIVSEMDWNEALRDAVRLKNRIVLIGIVVFVLITIGVFFFSSMITAPLLKLKEAAIRVGEGKFDWLLPVQQRDEIGLLTQVFNKMTLRLRQTTQLLHEREQRLLHFYRATIDGIMLHKEGQPVLVNRALAVLTGYTEDELLKLSPENLFFNDNERSFRKVSSEPISYEAILINRKQEKLPVEVQRKAMTYHDQEVEALVIRDISQRRAVEDELKEERLHRMRSVIDGQEQERQRLSRELHDGLGQTLVGIKLRLESIPLEEMGEERKTIEMVKKMFNQTIEETRRISNNLMPAALTEFSLAVVLRNLCTEVESNSGISVSFVVGVLPESINLLTKTYAYRIAQEALTNTVKHSGANQAIISVFSDIKKLYLHVEDNGCGFRPGKKSDIGNGLYNMKERASLLNGKLEVDSTVGIGTKIKVEFPLVNQYT